MNFLYLIQGRRENVLKYAYLQGVNSDLFVCTFDFEIKKEELNCVENIFLPNSTWAEGRNKQLAIANKFDKKYLYYIFIDDDVEFVKGNFYDFEQLLLINKPAVGVPLLTVIKKSYRYNSKLKIQHPIAVDQQVQAYHFKVLDDSIVMPLETKFDNLSWWYSCEINGFLILSKYKGFVMQFNDIIVENTGHIWSAENNLLENSGSNYLGGTKQEELNEVKKFILNKYGEQPKLRNSLFHDEKYSKFTYLPKGQKVLNIYIDYLKKYRFNNCLKLLISQIKNLFHYYPSNLIVKENQFKNINEYLKR